MSSTEERIELTPPLHQNRNSAPAMKLVYRVKVFHCLVTWFSSADTFADPAWLLPSLHYTVMQHYNSGKSLGTRLGSTCIVSIPNSPILRLLPGGVCLVEFV